MYFREIIGQEALKNRIREEIQGGKVSHAQLFLGKNGYGSLAMAMAYAQYLMCENRQPNDACGECNTCKKNERNVHPDVHHIFPVVQAVQKRTEPLMGEWREQLMGGPYFTELSWIRRMDKEIRTPIIGNEEIKDMMHKFALTSFEGGYRVFIIWKAEAMNVTFANKILKSLEEPQPKTLILLVAEDAEELLPTVLSRTQLKKVNRLAFDEVVDYLTREKGMSSSLAQSLAARYDGDVARILESESEHEAADLFREMFIAMMRHCYQKKVIEMMDWAEDISSMKREEQKEYLTYCLHMIRQSILRNYTGEQLFQVSDEEASFLTKFSRFITGNNIHDFMKVFSDAHYHIERNANSKILFTDLAFKTMRFIHFA